MSCFFFSINLLEFKSISECTEEVKQKFWSTYKIGVCGWPILQTINFVLIPEHNRVWTSFFAYMKSLDASARLVESKDQIKTSQRSTVAAKHGKNKIDNDSPMIGFEKMFTIILVKLQYTLHYVTYVMLC